MKYIAFYDTPELKIENRYVNAAARGVIEYMIEVLSSVEDVEVISPGRTLNKKGIYGSGTVELTDKAMLTFPFTFGVRTGIGRLFSLLWTQLWLFLYLFFHTKRGEKVVFYHSLSLMSIITLLSKIKGIKPVLEFREIYSDINKVSKRLTKKEHNYYNCAYAFIFPSEAIKNHLDIGDTPYVLAPGSYISHTYNVSGFNDNKTHLVYAGNLRRDKGGAYLAADAAEFLSDDFIIHILSGSYSETALSKFEDYIKTLKQKTNCEIVFEGAKFGDEFFSFLSRCDVGLATQNDGAFSNTSFPSKILTYMGCGLSVVAPPIDAVRFSPIGSDVSEYKVFTGNAVADAVKRLPKTNNNRERVKELDLELKEELKKLFI